jgi:hypothetical protein
LKGECQQSTQCSRSPTPLFGSFDDSRLPSHGLNNGRQALDALVVREDEPAILTGDCRFRRRYHHASSVVLRIVSFGGLFGVEAVEAVEHAHETGNGRFP